jgi:acetyl esterase
MNSPAPPLDPELRVFLDQMRAGWSEHPPFESLSFPERRAVCEVVRERFAAGGPEMRRTTAHEFTCTSGAMRIRIHFPGGVTEPAPALIYLHGGGFTLFSIDTHDRLMREYAAVGGFAVIGVDYPLSPEYKYPVALDCLVELLLWLKERAVEWGIDASRLAIGGDSAGGNLSFASFLRLRELGEQRLIKAILSNYGGFSSEISDESEARFGGAGSIMDRAEACEYWSNYFRDEEDDLDPCASPIHADLRGFPPTFLVIPECDIVAEHSIEMDARMRSAGAPVSSKIYRGAPHSFLEAMSMSAVAREAIKDGAMFVAEALEAHPS